MSFSGTQRVVFNAFKYALGTGEISNVNYDGHINTYITDCNFWPTNSANNNLNTRFNSFKNLYTTKNIKGLKGYTRIIPTKLTLENVNTDSFNGDTGLTSDVSYEMIRNTPASGKIFSTENNKSWVTHDLDWSLTALMDKNTELYFKTEYDFKNFYDKSEYRAYGLNETILEENNVRLTANNFKLDSEHGNKNAMDWGAGGFLLTYSDDEHKDGQEIPMVYIQFAKHFNSNNNHLEVDWHQDGIVKVE